MHMFLQNAKFGFIIHFGWEDGIMQWGSIYGFSHGNAKNAKINNLNFLSGLLISTTTTGSNIEIEQSDILQQLQRVL